MALLPLVIILLIFPLSAAVSRRLFGARHQATALATINIVGLLPLCVLAGQKGGVGLDQLKRYLMVVGACYATYVAFVVLAYVFTARFARARGVRPWVAFAFPIAGMLVVKYVPSAWLGGPPTPGPSLLAHLPEYFIGISYMAFRLSRLVLEVRNGVVALPSLAEYLGFAFLLPTLSVGPISSYRTHAQPPSVAGSVAVVPAALVRVVVGLAKYIYLGSLLGQLSYAALLRDGHPHRPVDLAIAAVAFYLYLYCNFAGYCDMATGTAAVAGHAVDENFDAPFLARNVREFWNRWHITLSVYLRDVVFTPVSTALVRRFGPRAANHCIAAAIGCVFLLMGLWHGIAWNFVIFGASHAVAVIANHYYTILLKKRLGKRRFEAYNAHRGIRAVAIVMTFIYVACTLFFFANTMTQVLAITRAIQW